MKYLCLLALILFTSCNSGLHNPDYCLERKETFDEYNKISSKRTVDLEKVYSLPECIKISKEYNLGLYGLSLERKMSSTLEEAKIYEMLPNVSLDYTRRKRDNILGSNSVGVEDGEESLRSSTSNDRSQDAFSLTTAISVLDFGLAKIGHSLEKDEGRLIEIKRMKTERELEMQIIESYMSVASTQYLLATTKIQLEETSKALEQIKKLYKTQDISEFVLLQFESDFLDTRKELREYERSYKNLCLELTSFMGLSPSTQISVDVSIFDVKNDNDEYAFPYQDINFEDIETAAFENRPEVLEGEINKHIAELQKEQEFLKMFPNVRLFASFNYSSNEFLYNQNWFEVGAQATLDLMNIPAQQERVKAAEFNILINKYRNIMAMFNIKAQLEIANQNLEEVQKRYEYKASKFKIYDRLKVLTREAIDQGSRNELAMSQTEIDSVIANIQRIAALSNWYVAYYRLLNTAGLPYRVPNQISGLLVKPQDNMSTSNINNNSINGAGFEEMKLDKVIDCDGFYK